MRQNRAGLGGYMPAFTMVMVMLVTVLPNVIMPSVVLNVVEQASLSGRPAPARRVMITAAATPCY